MLKNYFEIDENTTIKGFLKDAKEKKNSHYIILTTQPESFVDIRTIALQIKNPNEKLRGFKKTLSQTNKDYLNSIIESGDRVIKTENEYYDFIDALNDILKEEPAFINETLSTINKKEIYALNENDKISSARTLLLKKRINLLPVIKGLNIIGELRPIDLLVTDIYDTTNNKGDYYDEKYESAAANLSISNIINVKPLTVNKNAKIKEAIELMAKKKLPSLIITDDENKLHSVISYKDVFKQYKKDHEKYKYLIEYTGSDELYEDEFDLIQDFTEKTMKKIIRISKYTNLKITFKQIGDKLAGHKKKFEVKILLSEGGKTLHVDKEIVEGTSDELHNNKLKQKWNIPQTVQEALSALEKKVIEEKRKGK